MTCAKPKKSRLYTTLLSTTGIPTDPENNKQKILYKMYILKTRNKKDQTAEILWKVYQCTTHIIENRSTSGYDVLDLGICVWASGRDSVIAAVRFLRWLRSCSCVFSYRPVSCFSVSWWLKRCICVCAVRIPTRFVCLNDHSTMTRLFK
jgi:hypothetical protein